jgi:hypothetical protein
MARAALARFTEMLDAHPKQVIESDVCGRAAHCFENLLRSGHVLIMVSLLEPYFSNKIALSPKWAQDKKGAG